MIKVETNNPIPVIKRTPIDPTLRSKLLNLKPNSKPRINLWAETPLERQRILITAKRMHIKVTSRKVDGKGFRIWRTQ